MRMRYGSILRQAVLGTAIVTGMCMAAAAAMADQAIVVGVNSYPGLSNGNLLGCVNDANAMGRTLESYGFKTRLVLEDKATKAGVLGAIAALRTSVKPTERIVFYFAGHGTQTPSGGPRLLLTNALQQSTANDISRDELYEAIKAVPARARTVVLDSCFSGAMMRSVRRSGKGSRYYDRATRGSNSKDLVREKTTMIPEVAAATEVKVCYYAASGANEQAAEDDFEGQRHGVFTQFLVTGLANQSASSKPTWDDVDRTVSKNMRNWLQCTQTPNLTARFRGCQVFDAPAGSPANPVKPTPPKPDRTIWDQFNHGNPNPARVLLAMDPNVNTIPVDSQIHFNVKIGQAGYLVILELGTDGKIAPIYPEEMRVEAAHVTSGQVVHLPLNADEHYRPDEVGAEMLRAVLYSSKEAADQLIKAFSEKRSVDFKEFVSRSQEKSLIREKDKPFDFFTSELTFEVVPKSEVEP